MNDTKTVMNDTKTAKTAKLKDITLRPNNILQPNKPNHSTFCLPSLSGLTMIKSKTPQPSISSTRPTSTPPPTSPSSSIQSPPSTPPEIDEYFRRVDERELEWAERENYVPPIMMSEEKPMPVAKPLNLSKYPGRKIVPPNVWKN